MDLERMDDFFTKRVNEYESQMLFNVEGCRDGYIEIAKLVPKNCKFLLDLGCGTGLELKEIFKRFPNLNVTGVDLTKAMLKKLKENYPNRNINLICGNYFDVDFGISKFDCVISFETMHHFTYEAKINLYKKIRTALNNGGLYIECDYMAKNQSEEDFYFSELIRIRREQNIPESEFVHYDTPCTVDNQIKMFKKSGFRKSEKTWQIGQTAIIVNEK